MPVRIGFSRDCKATIRTPGNEWVHSHHAEGQQNFIGIRGCLERLLKERSIVSPALDNLGILLVESLVEVCYWQYFRPGICAKSHIVPYAQLE